MRVGIIAERRKPFGEFLPLVKAQISAVGRFSATYRAIYRNPKRQGEIHLSRSVGQYPSLTSLLN